MLKDAAEIVIDHLKRRLPVVFPGDIPVLPAAAPADPGRPTATPGPGPDAGRSAAGSPAKDEAPDGAPRPSTSSSEI